MQKTSSEIANEYKEFAIKLARIISDIEDIRQSCEFLSETTRDNADPSMELETCIEKCGIALASIIIYEDEYSKEQEVTYGK